MSAYGDALAAVGLHPDDPDGMYAQLQLFLQNPQKFKQADSTWRGAKDNLSWYESPKGVARIIWPFHWGSWVGEAPTNETQTRVVFKICNTPTKEALAKIYGFPYVSSLSWAMEVEDYKKNDQSGSFDLGRSIQQAAQAIQGVANTLHIPLVNITLALATGEDPIQALKDDVNSFMAAGAIAKGVVSGDMHPLAQQATNAAASFGVHLNTDQVAQVAATANSTNDPMQVASVAMGPAYTVSWQVATHGGTVYDAQLPAPPGNAYCYTPPKPIHHLDFHLGKIAAPVVQPVIQAVQTHPAVVAAKIAALPVQPTLSKPPSKVGVTLLYGTVGGILGFFAGGPPGAALGATLGATAGAKF